MPKKQKQTNNTEKKEQLPGEVILPFKMDTIQQVGAKEDVINMMNKKSNSKRSLDRRSKKPVRKQKSQKKGGY